MNGINRYCYESIETELNRLWSEYNKETDYRLKQQLYKFILKLIAWKNTLFNNEEREKTAC